MLHTLQGIDVTALVTGVIAIGGFATAAWTGIRAGLKVVRGEAEKPEGTKLVGGVVMDNMSMALLSERLREAADAAREGTGAMRELAHQVERLRDRMS